MLEARALQEGHLLFSCLIGEQSTMRLDEYFYANTLTGLLNLSS